MPVKMTKAYYSESEAARSLGMTVLEFRALVRRHIVEREEDMPNVELTTFHAADLLLLKMLSAGSEEPVSELTSATPEC
jgi:hypothetical protein